MQNFLKIADDVDVAPLRLALVRQPELFGHHRQRADAYQSPHTAMSDIWVRYNHIDNLDNPAQFNAEHDSVWYPESAAIPEVKPIVFRLMTQVQGERLGGILITKIPPGGRIERHTDFGWHAQYYDKYYVPVQNEAGALFCFDEGVIAAQAGEVYWFNNRQPHWVENNSTRDRIAMIVCIRSHQFQGA